MGIIRDSFVVFKNWGEAIKTLPEEYQLETYKALFEYGMTGIIPEDISAVAKAMITSFSVGMENSIARYNASVENGKLGGAPKGNQNARKQPKNNLETTQEQPKQPKTSENNLNVNVNVNDNVNDNNLKKEMSKEKKEAEQVGTHTKHFIKPSLEEVESYCKERNNNVNAERFIDFYQSKGWKIGKEPMKDWKACIRTWEQREEKEQQTEKNKTWQNMSPLEKQREMDTIWGDT